MIASFLLLLSALSYQAFLSAMAVLLHTGGSWFLVGPVLLVIVVFCFSIREGLLNLFFAGILIDSLTGSIVGTHMMLLVFLGLVGFFWASWLGKPHWPLLCFFLLGSSLIYRLALSNLANFGIWNLLLGPWLDMLAGLFVFYWRPLRVVKMDR